MHLGSPGRILVTSASMHTLQIVPAGPPPDPLIFAAYELGAAVLVLVASALFAHNRASKPACTAPSRAVRAAASAMAFTIAVVACAAARSVAADGWVTLRPLEIVFGGAFFLGVAALLFALIDRLIISLEPRRERGWLIASSAASGALALALLRLTYVPEVAWPATYAGLALSGVTGGIVWWSLLPAKSSAIAVFE